MSPKSAPSATSRVPVASIAAVLLAALACPAAAGPAAQQAPPPAAPQAAGVPVGPARGEVAPTRADVLRGAYGRYRANNDLLYYHLDVRVDPDQKSDRGHQHIRFRMLHDDTRIQLDLHPALRVDAIVLDRVPLAFTRDLGTVCVDFPETARARRRVHHRVPLLGPPAAGGPVRRPRLPQDPAGRPWINTACEDQGASIWWPNKDQWRDEVDDMDISVAVPNGLVDVSNGRLMGTTDLGDGYTRWDWHVSYPINNYDVSLNIGDYAHFADRAGDLPLDFYVLPEDLDRAKASSPRPGA